MGAVKAVVNRNALPARLVTWEQAQQILLEPAAPSTTRDDMRQQILNDALASRLSAMPPAAAAVLQAAMVPQTCNAQAACPGLVQGIPVVEPGK